jgi:hypothetical protein
MFVYGERHYINLGTLVERGKKAIMRIGRREIPDLDGLIEGC